MADGSNIPTFIYGTAWKEERTAELTHLALRSGFRAIDTANQRKHYYEVGVGEGLAAAYRTGLCKREDLFLQTKFTYQRGQDHRLPYDPAASLTQQVQQSLASSLEHLQTDSMDSFILHGPSSGSAWAKHDVEVWRAMVMEREAGRARLLGVSNISIAQLEEMAAAHADLPTFVQNRCYAQLGWDREVREWCRANAAVYQGFSLLTANVWVLRHPLVQGIAEAVQATPMQVVFAFARQVGILPLTGTTSAEHMREDLASLEITLPEEAVAEMERLGD